MRRPAEAWRPRRRAATIGGVRSAATLACAGLLAFGAAATSASPFPQAVVEGVEAWLDRPLPADAAAGTELRVGATIWSSRDEGPIGGTAVFFRLYAADGGPEFSEVVASEDWRGHFIADVLVPAGGIGELHIGTQGTSCDANGCTRSDAIYEIAGVGPPPTAPLSAIAIATVYAPPRATAGVPIDVAIHLEPRAIWSDETFHYPPALRLVVREPRGPDLTVVVAEPLIDPWTFSVQVVLPTEGQFALQAAAPAGSGGSGGGPVAAAELFGTSTILVEATAAPVATASPSAESALSGDQAGGRAVPLVAALAIALLGAGGLLALRRRPA